MSEKYLPKLKIDLKSGDVLTEYDGQVWSNSPPKNSLLRIYGTVCAVDINGMEHPFLYLIGPNER